MSTCKNVPQMPTTEDEPRRPGWRDLLAAYDCARDAWERDPSPHALDLLVTGGTMLTRELAKPGRVELGQFLLMPGASDAFGRPRNCRPNSCSATTTAIGCAASPDDGSLPQGAGTGGHIRGRPAHLTTKVRGDHRLLGTRNRPKACRPEIR
jgi:hypothetical protein